MEGFDGWAYTNRQTEKDKERYTYTQHEMMYLILMISIRLLGGTCCMHYEGAEPNTDAGSVRR